MINRPIAFVRKQVLAISQAAMAAIAGTTQATVSRWETGELEPNRSQLERIRARVLADGKEWQDAWFFEPPVQAVAEPNIAEQTDS
jgi:DNA-binding transcriptional regulator YiaG